MKGADPGPGSRPRETTDDLAWSYIGWQRRGGVLGAGLYPTGKEDEFNSRERRRVANREWQFLYEPQATQAPPPPSHLTNHLGSHRLAKDTCDSQSRCSVSLAFQLAN